jgi:hypothetical protein
MRLHVDLLGWFHAIWGVFGVLTGASLAVLALGLHAALLNQAISGTSERAAVWVFAIGALTLGAFGAANLLIGRLLRQRKSAGRIAAIALAVPNLVVVPFGTALGVYGLWVLLNDDARRQFGRPLSDAGGQPASADVR